MADEKRKRGRPDNGFILKLIKIAVESEQEFQEIMQATTTRSRAIILKKEIKNDNLQKME